jgi:hypothetical protein
MAVTAATVQAALTAIRAAFPGSAVTVTIGGESVPAVERRGQINQEPGAMGVFAGEVGRFHLTGTEPQALAEGEIGTIERGGKVYEFRVVGISRPYDGYVIVHYGDRHGRGSIG